MRVLVTSSRQMLIIIRDVFHRPSVVTFSQTSRTTPSRRAVGAGEGDKETGDMA